MPGAGQSLSLPLVIKKCISRIWRQFSDNGALAYAAVGCHETGFAHNVTVGQIVVLQHKVGLKQRYANIVGTGNKYEIQSQAIAKPELLICNYAPKTLCLQRIIIEAPKYGICR